MKQQNISWILGNFNFFQMQKVQVVERCFSVIPPLYLRSGNGVITVMQGYCKGIAVMIEKSLLMNPL